MKRKREQDGNVNEYDTNEDPQAMHHVGAMHLTEQSHDEQNDLSMSVEKRRDSPKGFAANSTQYESTIEGRNRTECREEGWIGHDQIQWE